MSLTYRTCAPFALAALLSACGTTRQSAATQAAPAAFDASKSDPKAIAVADQVIAALGGEANWQKAHELQWFQAIVIDGKLVDGVSHAWDRWNGRHKFTRVDPSGKLGIAMHDLYSKSGGYGYVADANGGHKQISADKEKMIAEASRRFDIDVYPMVLPFKLKDPGVHLKLEERPEEGAQGKPGAPMKYDVLEITFDDGVGSAPKDTWYLVTDKASHMPTSIEHHIGGKPENERSGFTLENWVEAGGLKFATVRKTLGISKPDSPTVAVEIPKAWKDAFPPSLEGVRAQNPGETVFVANVKVDAEPDERNYIPSVE